MGSNDNWIATEQDLFFDFMGLVESALLKSWRRCEAALDWYNTWGTIGLVGLHSSEEEEMLGLRTLITTKSLRGKEFNTYPKDTLTRSPDYTVILKRHQRTIDLGGLAERLVKSNRSLLQGSLIPTHIKMYSSKDVTRSGLSKKGWRPVVLKGDPKMVASLSKTEDSHLFKFCLLYTSDAADE